MWHPLIFRVCKGNKTRFWTQYSATPGALYAFNYVFFFLLFLASLNRQNNHGVKFRPTTAREDDTFSHEVWTWGKGHRGQHGHGDMLDRLVKLLVHNSKVRL